MAVAAVVAAQQWRMVSRGAAPYSVPSPGATTGPRAKERTAPSTVMSFFDTGMLSSSVYLAVLGAAGCAWGLGMVVVVRAGSLAAE